jgi:predicted nucleotide-binding protein
MRGNEIEENDKQQRAVDRKNGFCNVAPISGREYAQWMSEIKVFIERDLKKHPLYKTMSDAYFFRDSKDSAFDDMMGCLQTLLNEEIETNQTNIPQQRQLLFQNKTIGGVKMNQNDFIKKLLDTCTKLQNQITTNQIWNWDDGVNAPEYIVRTSAEFRKLKNDIDTYFSAFPSDEQQEANTLLGHPYIDLEWLDNMEVLLHSLANKILFKATTIAVPNTKLSMDRVFIVHGHDNEAKIETARVIEKLGLQSVILHEQASAGDTIIEKIERCSDVGFAIVLYTPCDEGHSKKETSPKDRARQNVVFEHGYLIGKLGRNHVCALVKGDIETPGDISGVVYIPMDNMGAWKYSLVDEMNAAGFMLNKNAI